MTVSARSYLIAGMAALSAGAIAVAPVQPLSHDLALAPAQVNSLAVGLAASIDPITPWIDTIQNSADNVVGLFNAWAARPFPIVQQVIANQLTYLGELPDIVEILGHITTNIGNAITAPFQANLGTLDEPHQLIWSLLPQVAPELTGPLIDFTTSSLSGILIGLVGPVVAPVLALASSVTGIFDALGNSDFLGALNELINIPANLTNAFLNGGPTLDLTGLVSALGVQLPSLIKSIGLTMGGVLSQGGSIFNSLDVVASLAPGFDIPIPGVPAGTIGSVIGLTNTIADAITVVPDSAAAKAVAAKSAAAEDPAESAEAPETVALSATVDDAAPAPEITVAEVTSQAATGDNDSAGKRGPRAKASRGDSSAAASESNDAPKRSAKAGASRAG